MNLAKIFKNEKGGAMLEFALAAPIFLALSFAGFEFSRSLKILQTGSTLSREVANISFRRCGGETGNTRIDCLQTVANEAIDFSRVTNGSVSVIISVYTYNSTRLPRAEREVIITATSSTDYTAAEIRSNAQSNQICPLGITTNTDIPFSRVCVVSPEIRTKNAKAKPISGNKIASNENLLRENLEILVSEVYIDYDPIVGAIGQVLSIDGGMYYDATII